MDCTNYRRISLMSAVGKVFARILNERVKFVLVDKVMDEQGGFRVGRGSNDQIFAVKQLLEKTIEKDKKIYMAFMDLEKVYDNVHREKLSKVLDEYGVKGRLLKNGWKGKGESGGYGIRAVWCTQRSETGLYLISVAF